MIHNYSHSSTLSFHVNSAIGNQRLNVIEFQMSNSKCSQSTVLKFMTSVFRREMANQFFFSCHMKLENFEKEIDLARYHMFT